MTNCSFLDLPAEVLQQIFASLANEPGSFADLCCCLAVCKHWNTAASGKEFWQHISIPFSRSSQFADFELKKLVGRSSNHILSLNLSGCHRLKTYTIMQVLLCNVHLIKVDLSYCPQVALHNLEHFLHSVTSQPHPELKQLTVGFTGMRRSQGIFAFLDPTRMSELSHAIFQNLA